MNLYFFILMQSYGEKPPIPNITPDFSLTTCDTLRISRQNPQMPLISVASYGYFVLSSKIIWKFRKKFLSLQPENVTFKFLDYERHYNIKRRNRDVPAG